MNVSDLLSFLGLSKGLKFRGRSVRYWAKQICRDVHHSETAITPEILQALDSIGEAIINTLSSQLSVSKPSFDASRGLSRLARAAMLDSKWRASLTDVFLETRHPTWDQELKTMQWAASTGVAQLLSYVTNHNVPRDIRHKTLYLLPFVTPDDQVSQVLPVILSLVVHPCPLSVPSPGEEVYTSTVRDNSVGSAIRCASALIAYQKKNFPVLFEQLVQLYISRLQEPEFPCKGHLVEGLCVAQCTQRTFEWKDELWGPFKIAVEQPSPEDKYDIWNRIYLLLSDGFTVRGVPYRQDVVQHFLGLMRVHRYEQIEWKEA